MKVEEFDEMETGEEPNVVTPHHKRIDESNSKNAIVKKKKQHKKPTQQHNMHKQTRKPLLIEPLMFRFLHALLFGSRKEFVVVDKFVVFENDEVNICSPINANDEFYLPNNNPKKNNSWKYGTTNIQMLALAQRQIAFDKSIVSRFSNSTMFLTQTSLILMIRLRIFEI